MKYNKREFNLTKKVKSSSNNTKADSYRLGICDNKPIFIMTYYK